MTQKPAEQTIRQQIIMLLSERAYSTRDLSKILRIREKEIYEHFAHIARSLSPQKKKLVTIPCRCLKCGYVFDDRQRFTRPSRCPHCRGERIQEPRFEVT